MNSANPISISLHSVRFFISGQREPVKELILSYEIKLV